MGRARAGAAVQWEPGKALPAQRGCLMAVQAETILLTSSVSSQKAGKTPAKALGWESKINPTASSSSSHSECQPQQSLLLWSQTDPGQFSANMGISQWETWFRRVLALSHLLTPSGRASKGWQSSSVAALWLGFKWDAAWLSMPMKSPVPEDDAGAGIFPEHWLHVLHPFWRGATALIFPLPPSPLYSYVWIAKLHSLFWCCFFVSVG